MSFQPRLRPLSLAIASLFAVPAFAAPMPINFAQTGFSGLLRTPHAEVVNFGDITASYNVEDNIVYHRDHPSGIYQQGAHKTLLLGVGLLPSVEFAVQNTHKRFNGEGGYHGGAGSDLSYATKISSRYLFPDSPFSFAVGMQDITKRGDATFHQNHYAVASYRYGPLRFSLGGGSGDKKNQMGEDYLSGVFGGVEYQAFDWLQLVADHDGTGANVGLKLSSPQGWLPDRWRLDTVIQGYSNSETHNRDNGYAGVQLTIPLTSGTRSSVAEKQRAQARYGAKEPSGTPRSSVSPQSPPKPDKTRPAPNANATPNAESHYLSAVERGQLANGRSASPIQPNGAESSHSGSAIDVTERLLKALGDEGFENIRIQQHDGKLAVAAENNLYSWNEMDAIGAILAQISDIYADDFEFYLLNNRIPVMKIEGNGDGYAAFLGENHTVAEQQLSVQTFDVGREYGQVGWDSGYQYSGAWVPRINLAPNLRSTIGTEWGVFDYSLALGTNLVMDMWKGASVDVRHLLPVSASDDPKASNRPVAEHVSEIDRALIHQAVSLPYGVFTQFSAGLVYSDYFGVQNESKWQSPSGRHAFRFNGGYFEHRDLDYTMTPSLGYYRYARADWDWAFEAHTGEYLYGDSGYGVRSIHWFGDTQVSIEFNQTTSTFAGLYFSFPLGPQRNMRPRGFQVTGTDQWRWGYYTRADSGVNYLSPFSIQQLDLQHSIDRVYFNRDRLSPEYIRANVKRLRE
ncbi:YjbH domain-containing protein [Ferrimonas pelagia]|uniref:Exopolysaccharide biosynthesis protein YbjH n=1 Tax=Ferrimonas pelagia TaxID=1177826 RepID=A0ABP9EFA6_9GAMM